MPEASKNPLSSRKPIGATAASKEFLKSGSARNPRGLEPSVIEVGGYGLLAYSLFNLVRSLATNKLSADPAISLASMSQLVSLSPIFLLGPVLIFAPQGAIQAKDLAKRLTRWLVVFFALLFFLFTPLSFLQRQTLINKDVTQAKRLEAVLLNRKQQILGSVQDAQSPEEIQQRLRNFPEIRQPNAIAPLPSPAIIRQQLAASLDTAVTLEVNRLKKRQQQRLAGITKVVISISLGSLLATCFFCVLVTHLFPHLKPSRYSLARSSKTIGKSIKTPLANLKKSYLAQLSRPKFSRFFAILGLQPSRPSRRRR